MNREDVIRMAREADEYTERMFVESGLTLDWESVRDKYFANLVAAAEREACAKACEDCTNDWIGNECAAAIRARGKK